MWDMKVGYEPILIPAALLFSPLSHADICALAASPRSSTAGPHMDSYTWPALVPCHTHISSSAFCQPAQLLALATPSAALLWVVRRLRSAARLGLSLKGPSLVTWGWVSHQKVLHTHLLALPPSGGYPTFSGMHPTF